MALPAIIGIPALVSFLVKVTEWIVAKFAARFTMRAAQSIAWVTLYIALVAAMAGSLALIISGISMAMPSEVARGIGLVKPSNFEACIAALYGAKLTVWVFEQKAKMIEWEQMRGFI